MEFAWLIVSSQWVTEVWADVSVQEKALGLGKVAEYVELLASR